MNNKTSSGTLKRLIAYVLRGNELKLAVVVICVLLSAMGTVSISLALKVLIDGYITPLIGQSSPDFTEFYRAITILGIVFATSVIASFTYNRIMVYVGQSTLKKIKDEMFGKMQSLPISYFDKQTDGSIMALYTTDSDALRQMIEQSTPQVMLAIVTIVATFISMLILSPILTVLAVLVVIALLFTTKNIAGKSAKYFVLQQQNIASLTGFIQERLSGQKVVKIFNHEQKTIDEFEKLNEELFQSAKNASSYASIIAPVVSNIGNIFFVLTAIVGGSLAINSVGGVTIGIVAAYMQFAKNFTQPFMQITQQLNSINTALAGASRIFELLDEKSEDDEGYVTLVNVEEDEEFGIIPVPYKTGKWAWKHPHSDGTVTYDPLTGDVVIEDMTFGYVKDKPVLKNISLYAKPGQKIAFVGATGAGKLSQIL